MRFLVDNQLPAGLARLLAGRGLECQHVLDLNLAQASDLEIGRYAAGNQMIVVSKDEDCFHLAARPDSEARLIWIRLGNCRTPQLLVAIDKMWPRVQAWTPGTGLWKSGRSPLSVMALIKGHPRAHILRSSIRTSRPWTLVSAMPRRAAHAKSHAIGSNDPPRPMFIPLLFVRFCMSRFH